MSKKKMEFNVGRDNNVGGDQFVDLSEGKQTAGGNLQNVNAGGDANVSHADDGLSQQAKMLRVLVPVFIAFITAIVGIYQLSKMSEVEPDKPIPPFVDIPTEPLK